MSNFLACPRWRKAGSEPSLVVGFGHVSCSKVASLRYQSKSSKPTSVPTLEVCLLQDYRFAQEHLFRQNLLSSVSTCEKWDREKKLAKKIFVLQASTYAVRSMSSTDAFKKQVQRDDYATHVFRVVVRNPS